MEATVAFWMDLQITSTLNLLSQSVHDKGVQTHGMRYLIDCCSEGGVLFRLRRRSLRRRCVQVSRYSNSVHIDPREFHGEGGCVVGLSLSNCVCAVP